MCVWPLACCSFTLPSEAGNRAGEGLPCLCPINLCIFYQRLTKLGDPEPRTSPWGHYSHTGNKSPQIICFLSCRSSKCSLWCARVWPRWWQPLWSVPFAENTSRGGRWSQTGCIPGLLPLLIKGRRTLEETPGCVWHMVWKWSKSHSSILQCQQRGFFFSFSERCCSRKPDLLPQRLSLPSGEHIWPVGLICCQSPTTPRKEPPSLFNWRLLPLAQKNRFLEASSSARWETWNKWMQNTSIFLFNWHQ